jgi:hypothetical protein
MGKASSTAGQWSLNLGKQQTPAEAGGGPQSILASTNRTLASWGFQNGQLHRQSLAADTLNFSRPIAAFDAADEIDFGQLVTLNDPTGRARFLGRRVLVPGHASGAAESKTYTFAGPWYWLERLIYHQSWLQLLINGALVPRQTSHLLLNLGAINVGTQIGAVAKYAIDQGAPFQLGTIDIPTVPFVTESTDQTCAQIVIDQLRWAPDAVAWFDYSTNPPTFHCRQNASLTPITLRLGPEHLPTIADEGLTIAARPDLQIPAVALRYERTDTKDGVEYLALGEDIAPPGATGREINALSQTISLFGFNVTTLSAAVLCETIDTTSIEWWKRVIPRLQDERIKNLTLVPNSVERVLQGSRTAGIPAGVPSSAYPRMLIEGQLVDWMRDATDNQLDWQQEELSAQFAFQVDTDPTSNVKLSDKEKYRIPVHLVSTNAPSGVSSYTVTETEEEGEAQPIGLAQDLYNALSGLEYEGTVNTTEQECTGYIGPGNTFNLANTAVPSHASMLARVQSVDEDIDRGQTRLNFGPTPALSVSAILELLRASRHRRRWTRTQIQTDGKLSGNANAKLGEATANNNTIPGEAQHRLFAVYDSPKRILMDVSTDPSGQSNHQLYMHRTDTGGHYIQAQLESGESRIAFLGAGGQVNIRTNDCLYLSVARTVSIKAVKSCDPSDPPGSNWVRLVLCSDRIRLS